MRRLILASAITFSLSAVPALGADQVGQFYLDASSGRHLHGQ
jgi:hypothetical protein